MIYDYSTREFGQLTRPSQPAALTSGKLALVRDTVNHSSRSRGRSWSLERSGLSVDAKSYIVGLQGAGILMMILLQALGNTDIVIPITIFLKLFF